MHDKEIFLHSIIFSAVEHLETMSSFEMCMCLPSHCGALQSEKTFLCPLPCSLPCNTVSFHITVNWPMSSVKQTKISCWSGSRGHWRITIHGKFTDLPYNFLSEFHLCKARWSLQVFIVRNLGLHGDPKTRYNYSQ